MEADQAAQGAEEGEQVRKPTLLHFRVKWNALYNIIFKVYFSCAHQEDARQGHLKQSEMNKERSNI